MKLKILILFLTLFGFTCKAQHFQLNIIGNHEDESKTIDSIGYSNKVLNTKLLIEEINLMCKKLSDLGYIENQIKENKKLNDTSYIATISLGNKIKTIHIYKGKNSTLNQAYLFNSKEDTLILPYPEIKHFLKEILQKLEQQGYAFAKLKLINTHNKNKTLYTELSISTGNIRALNEIVLKYSNERQKNLFPKGTLLQLNKKYTKTTLNKQTVNNIYEDFQKFTFINQLKYPEILFTKDTTKVYVYLEKKQSNSFDGYLSFSNDENKKLIFNGYLDITLQNTLKAGEQIAIYWKNDGSKQRVFNATLDLPYLFNSQFGIKALLNIFKQDSTYQNTKTEINLGYLLNINKRIYIGYQLTESSNIQNSVNSDLSDFKNSFATINYDYRKSSFKNQMFPVKSNLLVTMGIGKRTLTETIANSSIDKQAFLSINFMNNFFLNSKNSINLKSQSYFLKSTTYLTNELHRFGGVNSIRGFAENSLQASNMSAITTEYRYSLSPNIYLNSILDYCYYIDSATITQKNKINKLLGLGLGLGLNTKSGLLKFSLANGTSNHEEIKYYNTFIAISYNVKF